MFFTLLTPIEWARKKLIKALSYENVYYFITTAAMWIFFFAFLIIARLLRWIFKPTGFHDHLWIRLACFYSNKNHFLKKT